jgi:integrase
VSYTIKEAVEVEHVEGCRKNKGCGADCKRIKKRGEWEAHITIHPQGGTPVRRRRRIPPEWSQTGASRRAWAEGEQERLKAEILDAGTRKITVRELVVEWIGERRAAGAEGIDHDEGALTRYVLELLGDVPVSDVRRRHAYELVNALKRTPSRKGGVLAPRTVRGVYFLVRQIFEHACFKEYIPANPIAVPRGALPKREDKDPSWRPTAVFTAPEVEMLISDERIPTHRRVRYAIEFLGSLRTGQASALRFSDYDSKCEPLGKITSHRSYDSIGKKEKGTTKTNVPHEIPVHPVLAKILAAWKLNGWQLWMGRAPTSDDLILPTRAGNPRDVRKALEKFNKDLKTLGLRKRRHYDTRRTFISLALDGGASKDLLEQITHPRPKDSFDLYRTASWQALSQQLLCIKVSLRECKVLRLPVQGAEC